MQLGVTPYKQDPLPCSWNNVRRLHGHWKCTWSIIKCLLMPTLKAFAETRARNLPWQIWRSLQNNQISQNLSILSSEPLILSTSIESFAASSFFFNMNNKLLRLFPWVAKDDNATVMVLMQKVHNKHQSLSNKLSFVGAAHQLQHDLLLTKFPCRSLNNAIAQT